MVTGSFKFFNKTTPTLLIYPWAGVTPAGERGAPSIIFLAVAHEFQILIILHTTTMAKAAAMVWSGSSVGITIIRRRWPQWPNTTSWCEGISAKALIAFILGITYTNWPLFWNKRNNCTPPSWTEDLWVIHTHPLLTYSIAVMMQQQWTSRLHLRSWGTADAIPLNCPATQLV